MQRKRLIILFAFSVAFIIHGCYISHISLDILEPAKSDIPFKNKRLSILPVPGQSVKPGVFDSLRYLTFDKDAPIHDIKMGQVHGLYDILSQSPVFEHVVLTDSSIMNQVTDNVFLWDNLVKICNHDTTDAVLILTKTVGKENIFSLRNMLENNFLQDFILINNSTWVCYSPYKRAELFRKNFADTVLVRGGLVNIELYPLLYDTYYLIGENNGKKMVPYWSNTDRIYFSGPGKEMAEAQLLVMNEKWDEAAIIWSRLAENSKKGIAFRAAHNLALAYEYQDVLEQAYLWADYADSISESAIPAQYKKELQSRIKKREIIDKQLRIN